MIDLLRIEPVDVLYLRGNRLFSELGDAEPVMPPWPSLFAGAIRSRMLADLGAIDRFIDGKLDGEPGEVLGSGSKSLGSFRVAFACLYRDGAPLLPAPADLVAFDGDRPPRRLEALDWSELGVDGSFPLSAAPWLRTGETRKPKAGLFMDAKGIDAWQRGESPGLGSLVEARELWGNDPRLGIALSSETATAREGMLYTTRTVALCGGVSFLVGVTGAQGLLPEDGLLRLGGDGRGARVARCDQEEGPWGRSPEADQFTMTLVTPGIFEGGWLPTGASRHEGRVTWSWEGLRAELVAAAVPRGGVVSGWDLAEGAPKQARRVVPAGTVYWLKRLEGSLEALDGVRRRGLWPSGKTEPRQAEGFNNVWFGDWAQPGPGAEG